MAFLEENGITHGDIGPDTIFYDEKNNIFKIYDQELLAGKNSNLKLLQKQIKRPYLSPEQVYLNNIF